MFNNWSELKPANNDFEYFIAIFRGLRSNKIAIIATPDFMFNIQGVDIFMLFGIREQGFSLNLLLLGMLAWRYRQL